MGFLVECPKMSSEIFVYVKKDEFDFLKWGVRFEFVEEDI